MNLPEHDAGADGPGARATPADTQPRVAAPLGAAVAPLSHPRYRPEIDGLRAIAILAVLGYHAFPNEVRAGFVGVDIFFVISGFLISTILLENLRDGSFSFAVFYARRIRRIFPALIVVIAVCLLVGWLVLFQAEFRQLGMHAAAGVAFIANLVAWGESGYFDTAAETKPLLHLWSLGIEEQFYLIWPLLLWSAWRVSRRLAPLIALLLVASFVYNVDTLPTDAVAAFYGPLGRMWELLAGALLASLTLSRAAAVQRMSPALQDLVAWVGLAVLGYAIWATPRGVFFPGLWALPPVVGSALIILAGGQAWPNRTLLATPVMIWIGVISYPLYLWHWPLLSFARIVCAASLGPATRLAAIVVAIGLAWLTYRYVEKPIRFSSTRLRVPLLVSVSACLGLAGLAVSQVSGVSHTRMDAGAYSQVASAIRDWRFPLGLKRESVDGVEVYRNLGTPVEVLMIGDSHVKQFEPRILELTRQGHARSVALLVRDQCPPIPNVYEDRHTACKGLVADARHYLASHPEVNTVVLGGCWNCYFIQESVSPAAPGDPYRYYFDDGASRVQFRGEGGAKLAQQALRSFAVELAARYTVYVLLDNPSDPAFDPAQMLGGTQGRLNTTFRSLQVHPGELVDAVPVPADEVALDRSLQSVLAGGAIHLVEQLDRLCPGAVCRPIDDEGRPIYADAHHLRPFFVRERITYLDGIVGR